MTRFSTIIATYNRADLIGATIDSVLDQRVPDHDIIVVDDGSTDNTPDVLAGYGDRIRIFRQENKGPGAARSFGIEQAVGDYVTFIDSDDLYLPWTFETFGKVIDEHDRPAFVASHTVTFTSEPFAERASSKVSVYKDYFASWPDASWVPLCGVAVRADALREAGGFTTKRINYEESELWLKLGAASGFVRIESPVCSARREHEGNVTRDRSRSVEGVMHIINRERSGAYPGGPARQRERLEILTRHIRPLSLVCGRRDAWRLYRASLGWHRRLGRWRYLLGFAARRLLS